MTIRAPTPCCNGTFKEETPPDPMAKHPQTVLDDEIYISGSCSKCGNSLTARYIIREEYQSYDRSQIDISYNGPVKIRDFKHGYSYEISNINGEKRNTEIVEYILVEFTHVGSVIDDLYHGSEKEFPKNKK